MTLDEFMLEFLDLLSQLSSATPRDDLSESEEVLSLPLPPLPLIFFPTIFELCSSISLSLSLSLTNNGETLAGGSSQRRMLAAKQELRQSFFSLNHFKMEIRNQILEKYNEKSMPILQHRSPDVVSRGLRNLKVFFRALCFGMTTKGIAVCARVMPPTNEACCGCGTVASFSCLCIGLSQFDMISEYCRLAMERATLLGLRMQAAAMADRMQSFVAELGQHNPPLLVLDSEGDDASLPERWSVASGSSDSPEEPIFRSTLHRDGELRCGGTGLGHAEQSSFLFAMLSLRPSSCTQMGISSLNLLFGIPQMWSPVAILRLHQHPLLGEGQPLCPERSRVLPVPLVGPWRSNP